MDLPEHSFDYHLTKFAERRAIGRCCNLRFNFLVFKFSIEQRFLFVLILVVGAIVVVFLFILGLIILLGYFFSPLSSTSKSSFFPRRLHVHFHFHFLGMTKEGFDVRFVGCGDGRGDLRRALRCTKWRNQD